MNCALCINLKSMQIKRLGLIMMAVIACCLVSDAKDFKLPVQQFSKLAVDDEVNVVYVGGDGSASRVTYKGDQKYAKAFIITQNGNKLRIQVETVFVGDPELPTLYVYSDFLENASLAANSTLTLKSVAPGSKLDVSVMGNGSLLAENLKMTKIGASIKSGNGTITLGGNCEQATFNMIGNGTIQADRLKANKVTCKILGQGSIGCWPANQLKVIGIGNTKIYYKGKPEIDKKGGGKLIPLDYDGNEFQSEE